MNTVSFQKRSDFVFVIADRPGSCVVLSVDDGRFLTYRSDASSHNDQERRYEWAFEFPDPLRPGQKFSFSCSEWSVTGEVVSASFRAFPDESFVQGACGDSGPILMAVTRPTPSPPAPREILYAESPRPLRQPRPVRMDPRNRRIPSSSPSTPIPTALSVPASKDRELLTYKRAETFAVITATPKVSVVTCSYNRPSLLRGAVESLRRQTDQDWEHLIYDDASTDPRVEETLVWAEEDPRVRVWRGSTNLDRPAVLWNFLLDRARGRYFTVLDDDNEKLPDFVEVLSRELDEDPGLGLVTCGWVVVDPDGKIDAEYHLNKETCAEVLKHKSTCDGGAVLYRRELFNRVGYFSESLRTNEDWEWLRRAIEHSPYKNLLTCHSTYRSHKHNRMHRASDLGHESDSARVKSFPVRSATVGVRVVYPPTDRLTESQKDVISGFERGLRALPWVTDGSEIVVVIAPFQMRPGEIPRAIAGAQRVLSLHMEDPYALSTNLDRVREMTATCPEVWVSTNDISAAAAYRQVVGEQVMICPILGPDTTIGVEPLSHEDRDIDILLCGYAYPSRKKFVSELLPKLKDYRVLLVGDGWSGFGVESYPTQALQETYLFHARAKTVICLHRTSGDCSDGPVRPATLNRGYMEGYFGPRVFVDKSRSRHSLDDGDVVFYDGPADLAESIKEYLSAGDYRLADRFANQCATIYTHQSRVARILTAILSPRYFAEIP